MEYRPNEIEKKWQQYWAEHKTFAAINGSEKPKYYVLDMFPYPSGAGLHVGHPLGYIASDIMARYKRLQGYNVLHPMGYDSFGLPAEQYAIQTGQHPAITTEKNVARYREQLDKIGFSFDWDREVRTSDPKYYKWTQWIFLQLFNSWYNPKTNKAESIDTLTSHFEKSGFKGNYEPMLTGGIEKEINDFTAEEWKQFPEEKKMEVLMNFRLAYLDDSWVNWCPALGTVLANDEVKDGVSERGGHPVERKLMKQWSLRITAYAERLLQGLETIDWSDSLKEAQRNWIGKSEGASLEFKIMNSELRIEVFTTRPDTVFGVTFVVLAPEHELVNLITTNEQRQVVEEYITYAKNRSERERMADVKTISGVFTGAYVEHPFTGEKVPVWIADYVLAGYGTGAVMAVPCGDQRDYVFAKHFGLEIKPVFADVDISEKADPTKEAKMINSDFLNGLTGYQAIPKAIEKIEERNLGKRKINYRLRDAIFGRQRYWGEPIPIYYKNGIPYPVEEKDLPVTLPEVDKYLPTEDGEPPLARAKNWKYKGEFDYEHTTMPGWAGSSWYFLRYMDANNEKMFAGKAALDYWKEIDLYIGGAEHATGHLLYFRFWTKFLKDLGYISIEEPAKKLINQGMIQGTSKIIYRVNNTNQFLSKGLINGKDVTGVHIDINLADGDIVDIEELKKWRDDFKDAEFIKENNSFICHSEVDKMSKRWHNVVNPDDLCDKFGADTLRCYEMFLGPLEQHKPWDTKGIEGTSRFLKKLWRMYHNENGFFVSEEKATPEELKALHKGMKRMYEDLDRFSFNTVVSTFMIMVNELTDLKCNKREILESLAILVSPYAPHIAEELWSLLGHQESISFAKLPVFNPAYLVESNIRYPVQFNGKVRFNIELAADMSPAGIEKEVLANEQTQKYLEGKAPKKVIVVPKKIVNIVL